MKVTVLKSNQSISEAQWANETIEDGFEAFIGRSEDCHIHIPDPQVSRHQLVLRHEGGHWIVEKLTPVVPVLLNGNPLEEMAKISNGDVLSFPPYSVVVNECASPIKQQTLQPSPRPDTTMFSSEELIAEPQSATEVVSPMVSNIPGDTVNSSEEPDDGSPSVVTEKLLEDDISEGLDENTELSEDDQPSDNSHPLDDLGFGGEEDVIGSVPEDNDDFGEKEEESPREDSGIEPMTSGENDFSMAANSLVEVEPDEGTRVFQRFASFDLQLFGEYAPYDLYHVDSVDTYIGRDPQKCQIILNDPEVSSVHTVLRKGPSSLILEDLNSSNGTLLNGKRINKAELSNGDEFIVGSTTFTVKISSDLLDSESERLMPVESGQVVEKIEEIEEELPLTADGEVDFSGVEVVTEKSIIKRIWKDPKKRRWIIIAAVLFMVFSLLEDETTPPPAKPKVTEEKKKVEKVDPNKRKLSPEEVRALEARYKIAESYVKDKKLDEALAELEQIIAVDPTYKNAQTLHRFVLDQNAKIKAEQERLKMEAAKAKVKEEAKVLVAEAREAVTAHNTTRAEQLFAQILELDPENLDVTPMKQELEAWEVKRKSDLAEKMRIENLRKKMVDSLTPGKNHYLRREWYKAIVKLDEFLSQKGMDEDLIKEASDMVADARVQLASEIAPLLGKARSMKEGQDLKGAYETYIEVLRLDPINAEALNEVDSIRDQLESRSKRIYREAIISESLSLFSDAKEKFQEVLQVSPTDSEYYKKATDKLKNYLE